MSCSAVVARCYTEIVERFGVRRETWTAGKVTAVATTAPVGAEALASLSELGLAVVAASVRGGPPAELQIGLFVARAAWNGAIRVVAQARAGGIGWLLDCELRDEQGRLLSAAFAALPP